MLLASRATGPRRLLALFLLALFLGAGTTLPGPDALLYHWDASDTEQARPHIEAAGGCTSHLESCTLGRAATGCSAAAAAGPVVRLEPGDVSAAPALPARHAVSALRHTLPQPRAPPAAVA